MKKVKGALHRVSHKILHPGRSISSSATSSLRGGKDIDAGSQDPATVSLPVVSADSETAREAEDVLNGQQDVVHILPNGQASTHSDRGANASAAESVPEESLHAGSVLAEPVHAEPPAAAAGGPGESRFLLWHEAEELAKEKVGIEQWGLFMSAQEGQWLGVEEDQDAVSKRLRKLQDEYKDKQWSFERDGRDIAYADVIAQVVACVDNTKGLWAAAARLDPTKSAGVVWAGVEVLLTAAKNAKDVLDEVLGDADYTTWVISECKGWEDVCLSPAKEASSHATKNLRSSLVTLYSQILAYQVRSCAYLKEAKWRSAAKAAGLRKDERAIPKLKDSIERSFQRVLRCANAWIGEMAKQEAAKTAKQAESLRKMETILKQLHATKLEAKPATVSDLPALQIIQEVRSGDNDDSSDTITIKARLAFPNFPQSEELLDDVPTSSYGYKIESIDIWRILTMCGSRRSLWDSICQADCNRLPIYTAQLISFEVEIQGHTQLGPAVSVREIGKGQPHAFKVPKTDFASQIIRGTPITATKGVCGELYKCSTADVFPLIAPVAFCMTSVPLDYRMYTASDLERLKMGRTTLAQAATVLWSKVKGDKSMLWKLLGYNKEMHKCRNVAWLGFEEVQSKYPLLLAVRQHYETDTEPSEIEDVAKRVGPCFSTDGGSAARDDLVRAALALWDSRAKWLILAVMLNAHENLEEALALPKKFENLLDQTYCCLLP